MEFTNIQSTGIRASRIALGTWAIAGATTRSARRRSGSNGTNAGTFIATLPPRAFKPKSRIRFGACSLSTSTSIRGTGPDPATPMEETAKAMQALYDAGKIRAVGVSNFSPAQMKDFTKFSKLHTVQPPYNLFERAAELDVLPYALSHGLTALTYGALCRGLLSGSMRDDTAFKGDDLRRTWRFLGRLGAVVLLNEAIHVENSKPESNWLGHLEGQLKGLSSPPFTTLSVGKRSDRQILSSGSVATLSGSIRCTSDSGRTVARVPSTD